MGLPYDFLANPLGAVRSTFEKAMAAEVASGADPANYDGRDWGVADLIRQFLFDNGGVSQVNHEFTLESVSCFLSSFCLC